MTRLTRVQQITALIQSDPDISIDDIAVKLNVKESYITTLVSKNQIPHKSPTHKRMDNTTKVIRAAIEAEDKEHPLTDIQIAHDHGTTPQTVKRYRRQLGMKSSPQRRREYRAERSATAI